MALSQRHCRSQTESSTRISEVSPITPNQRRFPPTEVARRRAWSTSSFLSACVMSCMTSIQSRNAATVIGFGAHSQCPFSEPYPPRLSSITQGDCGIGIKSSGLTGPQTNWPAPSGSHCATTSGARTGLISWFPDVHLLSGHADPFTFGIYSSGNAPPIHLKGNIYTARPRRMRTEIRAHQIAGDIRPVTVLDTSR